MRYDTGLPGYYLHKTRGMITIGEDCDTSEGGLDELFFESMANQLTIPISKALKWDKKVVKQRLEFSLYHSKIFIFPDAIYIYLFIHSNGFLTALWTKCQSENSLEKANLYNLQGVSLYFKIVYYLPQKVKDTFLNRVCPNGIDSNGIFREFAAREKHDKWISELHSLYGSPVEQKPLQWPFETEISCIAWPDCEMVIYAQERMTEKSLSLIENLLNTSFDLWENNHIGEHLHDLSFGKIKGNQCTVYIDFGSIDPSVMDTLLKNINDSDLKIKRIVFR